MSKKYDGMNYEGTTASTIYENMIEEEKAKTNNVRIEDIEKAMNENSKLKELIQSIVEAQNKNEQQIAIRTAAIMLYRTKLFNKVIETITCIADTHVEDKEGNFKGVGASLVYNDVLNENVGFIHMIEDDAIEIHVNAESMLKINRTSPILEAFKELFEQMQEDCE